jgi:pimeloyl-ACP methyl ester carboxylesterase
MVINSTISDSEDWLRRYLAHPAASLYTVVDGTRVHYRVWSSSSNVEMPLLLFVHGYRGHTHWWDWIAPAFTDQFRVAAVDLSGMGKSEARGRYSAECFSRDVTGALAALNAKSATLIGHSYGGSSVLLACAHDAERVDSENRIRRAVILDSYVHFPDEDDDLPERSSVKRNRHYPSYEALRARYRLIPDQTVSHAAMFEHLARTSVRQTGDGWWWCFDPLLPTAPALANGPALLRRIKCPVDIVFGENSDVVDLARATATCAALPSTRGPICIPEARHHIMLDQPIALIGVLRALLA